MSFPIRWRSAAARIHRLNCGIPGAPRPLLPFSVTLATLLGCWLGMVGDVGSMGFGTLTMWSPGILWVFVRGGRGAGRLVEAIWWWFGGFLHHWIVHSSGKPKREFCRSINHTAVYGGSMVSCDPYGAYLPGFCGTTQLGTTAPSTVYLLRKGPALNPDHFFKVGCNPSDPCILHLQYLHLVDFYGQCRYVYTLHGSYG